MNLTDPKKFQTYHNIHNIYHCSVNFNDTEESHYPSGDPSMQPADWKTKTRLQLLSTDRLPIVISYHKYISHMNSINQKWSNPWNLRLILNRKGSASSCFSIPDATDKLFSFKYWSDKDWKQTWRKSQLKYLFQMSSH